MRMTGRLKLERFDKDFRLLERREQPMRSWTKGFIELLYTPHAAIAIGAPYLIGGDLDSTPRSMAMVGVGGGQYRYMTNHGLVASPAGFTAVGNRYATGSIGINGIVQGCDLGIQVGNDNTPVTPTDKRLARRIGHGIRAADGGDVTFESCEINDDADERVRTNDATQVAQPFTPAQDFRCTSVELKLWKTLAPAGPLTVEIRAPAQLSATQPWAHPSQTVLATGTILSAALGASPGAFVACVFGTPVDLYAGHTYFIVCHSAGVDAANYFNWRYDTAGTLYDRAIKIGITASNVICFYATTTDSWTTPAGNDDKSLMFKVIGRSIGEFEYGGTEVVHRVTANPNDAFDIKRFFYNRSGGAITVNEVGLCSEFYSYQAGGKDRMLTMLIARDVTAGVAVANNEILLVTYTPAIVV